MSVDNVKSTMESAYIALEYALSDAMNEYMKNKKAKNRQVEHSVIQLHSAKIALEIALTEISWRGGANVGADLVPPSRQRNGRQKAA